MSQLQTASVVGGNAPLLVMIFASAEAGPTYATVVHGQFVMQVVESFTHQQLSLASRAMRLVSSSPPAQSGLSLPGFSDGRRHAAGLRSVGGMLALFAGHVPCMQLAMEPAVDDGFSRTPPRQLPLTALASAVSQHRATTVIIGAGDDLENFDEPQPLPAVLGKDDVQRLMRFDMRSVSLSLVRPEKPLDPTSDLSLGAASLLAERAFSEESSGWVVSTGSGALPSPDVATWRGSRDCGRMLHFHWEPPAVAAQAATEAELVLGLGSARDIEAEDMQMLGERFSRADSGRVLAADEMGSTWPVPRGGADRWALKHVLADGFDEGAQEEPPGDRADDKADAAAASGSREAPKQRAVQQGAPRQVLDRELVHQKMVVVVDEALEILATSDIQADQSLMEVGLNSMHAAQLRDIIYRDVGAAHRGLPPLPATMVFDYPTKAAITSFLTSQVAALAGPPPAEEAAQEPRTSKTAVDTRLPRASKTREKKVMFEEMLSYTRKTIADVIGVAVGDDVPLMNAGVNSMHAAQLRDFLQAEGKTLMGLQELQLPATLVFDFPSTAEIAGFLYSHVGTEEQDEEEAEADAKAKEGEDARKDGDDEELEEEESWCVAKARRQLRRQRKFHQAQQTMKFYHLCEAPAVDMSLTALGHQTKSFQQAPSKDLTFTVPTTPQEAIKRLTGGYFKAEGRLFLATAVNQTAPPMDWLTNFKFEMQETDAHRFKHRPPMLIPPEILKGARKVYDRYSIAGSWNKWKPEEMQRTENDMFMRTVNLRAGETEEFQILCEGDYNLAHYPPPGPTGTKSSDVMGPGEAHGRNFFIQAPRPDMPRRCTIVFSPGGRRVHWMVYEEQQGSASSSQGYSAPNADPVAATASWAARRDGGWKSGGPADNALENFKPTVGYFVVGNWDCWTDFIKFKPHSGEAMRAEVRIKGGSTVEFQIVADRDMSKHYAPRRKVHVAVPVTGGKSQGIQGPTDLPSLHWSAKAPGKSKMLFLTWNPTGERSLVWEFK